MGVLSHFHSCKNLNLIKLIYEPIICPILNYGAVVWRHSLGKSSYQRNIDKVQRTASLLITAALWSTSYDALDTLLHLKALSLFVEE